jgi:hypothetical protein
MNPINHTAGAERSRFAPAFLICCLLLASATSRAQMVTPAALDAALQSAQPGSIVDLQGASTSGFLNQNPNQQSFVAGTMVFSDDPETAYDYGVLYRSPVPAGHTRVYAYHVNGLPGVAKITAVLQNTGTTAPATVQFTRKSLRPPSGNYIDVGKNAVKDYYENTSLPPDITILAGGTALLDQAMDSMRVFQNQLMSAKYDFTCDQQLIVSTLMLPDGANTLANNMTAPVAPGDTHNRQGTFPYWGKHNIPPYNYTTTSNIRGLRVGDPNAIYDGYVQGFDFERQVATENYGNFGITYTFRLNVSTSNNKNIALLLNPRGGSHAGYVRTTFPAGAQPKGQLVPHPELRLADTAKAIVCATIAPSATPQLLTIDYMPPGASNLPVNLLLIPYSRPATVGDWELY